uniref:protein-serine/threonine phosphatase n=1 Tax=Nothoprocta perdicaria TaxID=30464 RepID=A0A8C6YSG1_NOTPE
MMRLLRPQDAVRLWWWWFPWSWLLLVVGAHGGGCPRSWVPMVVDAQGLGCLWWGMLVVVPMVLGARGGGCPRSRLPAVVDAHAVGCLPRRAVLQELHRACGEAARGGHIPGGQALAWAAHYAANVTSEQSCINEWLAMADLESVRPSSPPPGPAAPELTERAVRALLRDVMAAADLESVTSKEVRTELERRTGHSLAQHKDFIDNEMLLVLAQMDRPSRIFPHLYLGSEWNAANLEELQQNQVTHILNVAREIDNFFPALFTYMNVRVYDEDTAQLLPHWNDTFHFLSDVRARRGRVLVHCRMGLSRSAATVLAYAMKEFGWPLERALRHVRRCRPGVVPNPGFMRQLDFYQGILQARWAGGHRGRDPAGGHTPRAGGPPVSSRLQPRSLPAGSSRCSQIPSPTRGAPQGHPGSAPSCGGVHGSPVPPGAAPRRHRRCGRRHPSARRPGSPAAPGRRPRRGRRRRACSCSSHRRAPVGQHGGCMGGACVCAPPSSAPRPAAATSPRCRASTARKSGHASTTTSKSPGLPRLMFITAPCTCGPRGRRYGAACPQQRWPPAPPAPRPG